MADQESIISIRTGWTFSKAIESQPNGEFKVIQLRDAQNVGLDGFQFSALARTDIHATREVKTLSNREVLLIAKGPVKTAILLDNVPDNTVANQHFFIIKVLDTHKLLPEYLAVYLNSKPVQNWFSKHSGGSYQSTLTKKKLIDLKLPVDLPIEQQKKLVELSTSIEKEKYLYRLLIKQREQELDRFSNKVWEQFDGV